MHCKCIDELTKYLRMKSFLPLVNIISMIFKLKEENKYTLRVLFVYHLIHFEVGARRRPTVKWIIINCLKVFKKNASWIYNTK